MRGLSIEEDIDDIDIGEDIAEDIGEDSRRRLCAGPQETCKRKI